MGWLVSALIALLVLSALAVVSPAIFGPAVAGLAPLLIVVAVIGLGAVWWRGSQRRVDPGAEGDGDEGHEDQGLHGEDERPET